MMANINNLKGLLDWLKLEIMKMVDEITTKKSQKLGYCKIVYGIVRQCNTNGSYDVLINEQIQTLYPTSDYKYLIGDTVVILVLNASNYSNKMILCKKPISII